MITNMETRIPFIAAIILLVLSNLATALTISKRHESDMNTVIEADRACRPGIYKHILATEGKAICVGGTNDEWVVEVK